ncbi:MAG: hypothetical protein D6795_06500, partial [Deltaproteobacteria bacterium]
MDAIFRHIRLERQGKEREAFEMGRIKRTSMIVAAVLMLGLFAGCGGEATAPEGSHPTQEELIEYGKAALSRSDFRVATEVFERVLTEYDAESNDARFGWVLAQMQFLANFFEEVFNNMFKLSPDDVSGEKNGVPIIDIIQNIVEAGFVVSNEEQQEMLREILASGEDFSFRIESFPISLFDKNLLEWSGEFDIADVHMVLGVLHFLHGVEEMVTALNLQMKVRSITYDENAQNAFELLHAAVMSMVSTDVPAGLMTMEEDQLAKLQNVAADVGIMIEEWRQAILLSMEETDDQSDDIITYDGTHLKLPSGRRDIQVNERVLMAGMSVLDHLSEAFLDQSKFDVSPSTWNPFDVSAFNPLVGELYTTVRDPERYDGFWQWFIVNVAANWIEEYVFSGFEPGCLQWDIAEKF